MGGLLADVWRSRWLWLSLVRMDLAARYRRSVLGLGWSLLHPIALTAILWTVFSPLFVDGVLHYPLYVLTGLIVWHYLTTAITQGCSCFLQGELYIRQYPVPLAIFPLRAALGGLVHFLAALAVVLAAAGLSVGFPRPVALLGLVPGLALLFALAWSAALLAGFANVLFRDTEHLAQVGLQLLFYATPIIYPARLLDDYRLGWLLQLNPARVFLALVREPILDGQFPAATTVAAAALMVLLLAGGCVIVLRHLQRQLIFYL